MRPTAPPCRPLIPALAVLLGLAACSDEKESPKDSAYPGLGAQESRMVELDDEDFESFLAAMKDLKEKGAKFDVAEGAGSDFSDAAAGMRLTSECLAVLDRHDLDEETFQRIQYNVLMAFGAVQSEEQFGRIQEQEAKNEGSAEEEEALGEGAGKELRRRMREAQDQVRNTFRGVPEANKKLVKKYQAELDALIR
ncbi:MAG: hypothetical protein HY812_14410 [Planctomycetes bacterium]|nr:hypothetical protein [Planctomycetota bacterium]